MRKIGRAVGLAALLSVLSVPFSPVAIPPAEVAAAAPPPAAAVAPAAVAPEAAAKPATVSLAPVEPVCGLGEPGYAHCLALRRTDIPATPAVAMTPSTTPAGYGPADLASAYSLPGGSAGSGMTVAVVDAYDLPTAEADLATYRAQYGLPACTTANGCFRKVNQTGGTSYPAVDAGWGQEIALDIDMVSATCPNCHILLVETNTASSADLGTGVNTAVGLGAMAVSNSYGRLELGGDTVLDATYYNHPGVAITAASGDWGYDAAPYGPDLYQGVEYPAASPNVVAVGGTSLVKDASARGWSESAWGNFTDKIGAGSGCATYEPKPAWQTDSQCAKRMVTDVSAVADPATGVAVYDSAAGGWSVLGGTSASSPIIASIFALAGAPAAGSYPASFLYSDTVDLNDVTAGNNDVWAMCSVAYFCSGVTGYDGPTGLGTPIGLGAFRAHVPGAPINVSAALGDGQITVSWSAPHLDGGTSIFRYTVTSTPDGRTCTWTTGPLSCTVTGLTNGTGYTFTVTATNAVGTGPASDPSAWTVPIGRPGAPRSVFAFARDGSAQVFWNAPASDGGSTIYAYTVTSSSGKTCSWSSGPLSCTVSGLTNGNSYTFTVTATNYWSGVGPASDPSNTITVNPPMATSIAAGWNNTCALVIGGEVECWGDNTYGQLGSGSASDPRSDPEPVVRLTGATAITVGYGHACALVAGGAIECWGENNAGQLGDGTKVERDTPTPVAGISSAVAVAAGSYFTCALLANGTAECWGDNGSGELGNGGTLGSTTPVVVTGLSGATVITAGFGHACAVLGNGTVQCWGGNSYGELGVGDGPNSPLPVAVPGAAGAVTIAAGNIHTCAGLASSTVCWGSNAWGQLGIGTSSGHSATPVTVTGLTVVSRLAAGNYTCALIGNGTVECWGPNGSGELGDGTTASGFTPVSVSGVIGATAVAVGQWHACALVAGGGVRCWGDNSAGQLGDGTTATRLVSVPVVGLPTAPDAPTGATAVAYNRSAVISWTSPAGNGSSSITNYTVTSSPDGRTCGWSSGPLSCTVTNLTNGQHYTFTVTATNGVGTGPASDPSNSVTPAAVPGKPTDATAIRANASALVSWTPPADIGGSAITAYTVTSSPGGKTCSWTSGPTSCTVTTLTNGQPYTFTVVATNGQGTGPGSDPSAAVTPATLPGKPTAVTAAPGLASALVSWAAPADNGGATITGYAVTSSPAGKTCAWTSGPLSCTVAGLTNGQTYTFTVVATNDVGTGPASDPSSGVIPGLPGKPAAVTAVAGVGSATVSWTAPADNGGSSITGYLVTSSPGARTCSWTSGPLSCTVSSLTNGQPYTFTVTATNVVGTGPASDPSAAVTPMSGSTYHALTPTRILDSRDGTGGLSGPFSSHVARTFTVIGHGGVPSNAIAVTGNLTVTQQTSLGFLFIGPVGANNPASSTLNFPQGDDRANAVTVALSGTGTLSITYAAPTMGQTAQVIFDVTGFFTLDTSGSTYHALTPTRILDSRDGTGGLSGPFSSHVARTFTVIGHGGVPSNAIAVTGNLTVTQQTSLGFLFIGPVGANNPASSTLNFPQGDDRANAVTVALSGTGTLSITYAAPTMGQTAQVIFDVTGFFTLDTSGSTYHALTPTRILDSRDGTGGLSGPFSSHVARTFTVIGHGGVPSNAIAVTGNLTVTQQTSLGFLFIGPVGANNPASSTLNFPKGDDRANAVTVNLGTEGILSITYAAPSLGMTAHVIFDVTGYFSR